MVDAKEFFDKKERKFVSFAKVKEYFEAAGLRQRVMSFDQLTSTVEEAAAAIGCQPKHIAKTLSFFVAQKPVMVVASGDAKIDGARFKKFFHQKAAMIPRDQLEECIGYAAGGVCPFALNPDIAIYLDISLRRFETIYPAAGNAQSAVRLSPQELEEYSHCQGWIDVCKGWRE